MQYIREHQKATIKQCKKRLGKNFSAYCLAHLVKGGLLNSTEFISKSTIGYQYIKTARINQNYKELDQIEKLLKRSPKQKKVYYQLTKGETSASDLNKSVTGSSSALKNLKEKGLIEIFTKKVERSAHVDISNQPIGASLKFTPEQKIVFE